MLKEHLLFFEGFLKNFESVGSFCSTTRWAARELCAPLLDPDRPAANILEVGAGTGSVTLPIINSLKAGDSFTICELEPSFMATLKQKITSSCEPLSSDIKVNYFEGPIQELPEDISYDYIICSLPFLNFPPKLTAEIFKKFQRLANPEARMTYYEYFALRAIGKYFPIRKRQERFFEIDRFFRELHSTNLNNRTNVWRNLLPIHVYSLDLRQ